MASALIHLAIGMKHINIFEIENKKEFLDGCIAPDIIGLQGKEQKYKAHYSEERDNITTVKEMFASKTNLYNFLKENDINSDYNKGYFLHLIGDYYFFNYFLYKPELEDRKISFKEIYKDYERVAKKVREKYNVDDSNTPWHNKSEEGNPIYFTLNGIFDFIEKCGKIELNELKNTILNAGENWRNEIQKFYN